MKKVYLIVLLLLSFTVFSQNIAFVENRDIVNTTDSLSGKIDESNIIGQESEWANCEVFKNVHAVLENNNEDNALSEANKLSEGEIIGSFTDDLIKTVDDQGTKLKNLFNSKPETVRAWKGLSKTGLRKDVDLWLPRASKWLDEGYEFVENSVGVLIKSNGDEVVEIV